MKFTVVVICLAAIANVQANFKNLKSFSWSNCGPNDPIQVLSLSISPDPIVLPGSLYLDVTMQGSVPIVSPTPANFTLLIQDSPEEWREIPCHDQSPPIGSCEFNDICEVIDLTFPRDEPCPPAFESSNVTCRCPFYYSDEPYVLTGAVIDLEVPPPFIVSGEYQVKIVFYQPSYVEIMCVDLMFSIVV